MSVFSKRDKNQQPVSQPIQVNFSEAKDVDYSALSVPNPDTARESDENYRKLAYDIFEASRSQLEKQNGKKDELKKQFTSYFKWILVIQLLALFVIIILKGFSLYDFDVSDNVFVAIIVSVFVETLGVIGIMIKYAFDSDQEVQILTILNSIVKDYQKFK